MLSIRSWIASLWSNTAPRNLPSSVSFQTRPAWGVFTPRGRSPAFTSLIAMSPAGDGPLGPLGDDDDGAPSFWDVLSVLGFFPVCPGSPVYEIGSPLFAKAVIRMANGKEFAIVANQVSAQNKYIQSARLNGKPLDKPWFSHSEIAGGETLILEMDNKPNRNWGNTPGDAPPSMSDDTSSR